MECEIPSELFNSWRWRLTSRNLPLPPLTNAEFRDGRAHLDSDTAVEDEKNHLHFPTILAPLRASGGQIDDAGAEEGEGEGLGEAEFGAADVAHFDCGGGVGDF